MLEHPSWLSRVSGPQLCAPARSLRSRLDRGGLRTGRAVGLGFVHDETNRGVIDSLRFTLAWQMVARRVGYAVNFKDQEVRDRGGHFYEGQAGLQVRRLPVSIPFRSGRAFLPPTESMLDRLAKAFQSPSDRGGHFYPCLAKP